MGALLAIAALVGIFAFAGKGGPQPADELGTRVAHFSVDDTAVSPAAAFDVYITVISSDQIGWYAYKGSTRIGSGSGADDDVAVASAWEFLVSQISSGASVKFEIFGPNGDASGKVDPQGGATIEDWRWDAFSGAKTRSAVESTRGAAIMAMLDWIEENLSSGKQGVGQPGGKHSGNGVEIDDACKAIAVSDFPAFLAYAKPRIESAFAGNKPPSAQTLATKTIGPAAGLDGCPRPATLINGKAWSEIEPIVKKAIADVTSPTWLSVAEPTVVLAHLLVNTKPDEAGTVENYRDHAIVVRQRDKGAWFALIFPGPARTLDADAEMLVGVSQAKITERARQRVNALEGGVLGGGGIVGPAQQGQGTPGLPPKPYHPPKPGPGKSKDWACAATGYNPVPQIHQIPQVGWASRKTVDVELFKIEGKWANCTRYDVRVGVCLHTGLVPAAYGELAGMLASPQTADMTKVPVSETVGGTLSRSLQWQAPPSWKTGIRLKIRKQGGAWIAEGATEKIDGAGASINACPGTGSHWPIPNGPHFNVRTEGGNYEKWDSRVTAEISISGNRVMLKVSYSGIPQFKKVGGSYRAKYVATALVLSTRVDARGEP